MKTLQQLREERAKVHARIKELATKAEAHAKDPDGTEPLTEDERAEWDLQEEEYDRLSAEITEREAADKAMADRIARSKERDAELAKSAGRKSQHPTPGRGVMDRITDPKAAWEDDPKKGFRDHREFLSLIMESGRHGRVEDARLKFLAAAGSDEQSTFSDPYGGFLLPEAFSPQFLSVASESDPTAGRTTDIPMESPTVKIRARVDKNHNTSVSGGLTVSRRAESDSGASSRMEFEQVTLSAHSLYGLAYATEELLERSPMSFVALLEAGFQDEFASRLIDEKLNGSGVGEYEGVMNSPCVISVAKESAQAAATIVFENVVKMRARCWRFSQAIWLANHDTLPQLMTMTQDAGTGGVPAWQPSAREGEPDMLLGRPIYFTEYTQSVGTVGDIVLGVWSQFLEGTLSPIRSAESMHVRFIQHERTFKFWTENDGRCWWRSALTPKRGSTLSPFVTLATRA